MAYKYTLSGIDLSTIGVYVEAGSDDLLKLPDLKEPYSYSWPDKNGIEVDLTNPVFKEKEITLEMAIIAADYDEFWSRYNALRNLLITPGRKRLYCGEVGRSFFVYYSKMNSFQRLTRLREGEIGAKYNVTFIEPIPSLNNPFAFLTKKNGGLILTQNNNPINVAK